VLVKFVIASAARAGTWSVVRQYPKTEEVAIRMRTIARVPTQSSSTFQTPFQFKPITKDRAFLLPLALLENSNKVWKIIEGKIGTERCTRER